MALVAAAQDVEGWWKVFAQVASWIDREIVLSGRRQHSGLSSELQQGSNSSGPLNIWPKPQIQIATSSSILDPVSSPGDHDMCEGSVLGESAGSCYQIPDAIFMLSKRVISFIRNALISFRGDCEYSTRGRVYVTVGPGRCGDSKNKSIPFFGK
ncbi:hypothetical protein BDQ17DRAFT_1364365 [Cyathus striatus]|nr:hypothetical protein BDQ17DRAFT_1364365 [Cyathus striatus]